MGMIRKSSKWEEKESVKKGNIGEELCRKYLEKKGYVIYQPTTEKAHSFDNLVIKDKTKISIVEIKTKPRRLYYEDTGINFTHYKLYKEISKKHNLNLIILFVDEIEKKIYGNTLENLEKEVVDKNKYPLIHNNIIYFHLSNMKKVCTLTKQQCEQIKRYTNSKYHKYSAG